MTREELEQCIGYEVIVHLPIEAHMHGVLVGFDDHGHAIVDEGDSGGEPGLARIENVTCLAIVARRHQETLVRERLTQIEDPKRPKCTCPEDALVSSCPRHGARAP